MKKKLLALAEKHGTPLFILDHEKIRKNYRVFKRTCRGSSAITR